MSHLDQLLNSTMSWVKYSPWEREGYCNEQGQCWFQQYGKWILARPGTVDNAIACLPAYVNPTPQVKETSMTDHLTSRAQRLIDEFEQSENVREGIANVLTHLANSWDSYSDDTTLHGVRVALLDDLADELTAPSLLERAMAGDAAAARQFLHEAGFTDASGNWLPQYQSTQETTND